MSPPPSSRASFDARAIFDAVERPRSTAHIVRDPAGLLGVTLSDGGSHPVIATLPGVFPERLGDRTFTEAHGVRFPYCTGAMANGIATTRLVIEVARAGMLGFFGAAGLHRDRVSQAIDELVGALGGTAHAWGVNLIHSPNEPALEAAVADMLVARGVTRVEASAFMALTPSVVRYACAGLRQLPDGRIARRHHVFAKISRPEVARHFLAPAPDAMLDALVREGKLTADEARLARHVAVAEDITVESDSGGHTDNRPLMAVLPVILSLRDDLTEKHRYARPVRVGAAGGLGTPGAVAAAFQLGAAYVLTGSVNQAAVESGLSEDGRAMLAQAALADVIMAPAADMFELGVKVQVLRRGTMFGTRALRLYDAFVAHDSLEAMPSAARERLEREVLGTSLDAIWAETRAFWQRRDPGEIARAEANPKHRMALCFRWYLGMSSRWAIAGERARKMDYQVWCGPAMGAFNDWVRGSFLEPTEARTVVQIARNLLEGAAVITRAQQLRAFGVAVPERAFRYVPRPLS
jgi:trans-AT polyketide synthase/acyltransferase/oxidoreductase domain-containing protein